MAVLAEGLLPRPTVELLVARVPHHDPAVAVSHQDMGQVEEVLLFAERPFGPRCSVTSRKTSHRTEHLAGRIADGRGRDVGDAFGAVPGNQDGRTRQSEAAPLAECPVDGTLDLEAAVLIEHLERRTDGAPRGLIRAPPRESLGERIEEIDPPLRVGGDHRVAHAGQRDAVPFLGLAEFSLGLSGARGSPPPTAAEPGRGPR